MYQFDDPNDVEIDGVHKGAFQYWARKVEVGGQSVLALFNPNIPITDDTILYAVYQVTGLTVSYNPGEGVWADGVGDEPRPDTTTYNVGEITRIGYVNNSVLSDPLAPDSSIFVGWTKPDSSSGIIYYQGSPYPVTGNTTFTARYIPFGSGVQITYYANDGTTTSRPVTAIKNEGHTTFVNPEAAFYPYTNPPGFEFVGWSSSAEQNGPLDYDEGTPDWVIPGGEKISVGTSEISLYAVWRWIDYTVIYAPGTQGTWDAADETYTAQYGEATPTPSIDPYVDTAHAPGYSFAGWDTVPTPTVTGTVTYTAQWRQDRYIVSFVAGSNGSLDGDVEFEDILYGTPWTDAVTVPTPVPDVGYRFVDWTPSFPSTVIRSNEYTANFEFIDDLTVTFVDWDGTLLASRTVSYGGSAVAPADPVRPGYDFAGWDSSFDNVIENITVTALYTPIDYTIAYVLDGGTNAADNPASYNVTELPVSIGAATRADYTFTGWTATGAATITTPAVAVIIPAGTTGNITLTANWTLIVVPVTPPEPPVVPGPGPAAVIPVPPADEPLIPIPDPTLPLTPSTPDPSPPSTNNPVTPPSIPDPVPPQGPPTDNTGSAWALVNLILTVVGALLAFVVLVAFFVGRKEEKEEDTYAKEGQSAQSAQRRKRIGVRIVSLIAAIAAIIVFVLTEDMRQPMQLVDVWTIVHAVIFIVQIVLTIFATRKKSDDDTKPLATSQSQASAA
jgi:uncharacterized repeat protein (TIGR02543 family)